jgi:hypothetical protein
LVGMRVGAHRLEVQAGRYRNVPRDMRACKLHAGQPATVEDLLHFVLECPAYDHVRARYPCLFLPLQELPDPPARMRALFNTTHQLALASCLHAMLAHRAVMTAL